MEYIEIGVASYNLWRGNQKARVYDDLEFLMGRDDVDLICFQEGALWFGLVKDAVKMRDGWDMVIHSSDARVAKQNIIIWRTKALADRSWRFVDMAEVNSHVPDRAVSRVRFEVCGTKHQIVLLATHMHSHVENDNWWHLPRLKGYIDHMRVIRGLVADVPKDRAVLAVADWNVDQHSKAAGKVPFFPKRSLARVGMRSNWADLGFGPHGTHGNRYIDAIFARLRPWLEFKRHQTFRLSSDHDALLVIFRVQV